MTHQTQFYSEPTDRDRVRQMEQASRRRMLPETSGFIDTPPVLHREPYTPTLRRVDWAEVALIAFGAVVVFIAGYLLGGGRVGL